MARILWLARVLRDAGLTVHERPGWKTRGNESFGPVRGITCHATAGSRNGTDEAEIRTLINGRPGLSGPIAQLYLGRNGEWHVIASGLCHHNFVGWAGPNKGFGNGSLLGIEAANNNGLKGEPFENWPEVQLRSYVRGVAALVRKLDIPVGRVGGHKEHQPAPAPPNKSSKTDPTFDMKKFRADVAATIGGATLTGVAALAGEDQDMTPEQAQLLKDSHFVLARAVPSPTGTGRVPMHVWASWMTGAVKALATAVSHIDEETKAQLQKDLDSLEAQVGGVPDKVVDALDALDAGTPEEIADRLRATLGSKASAVGALLVED